MPPLSVQNDVANLVGALPADVSALRRDRETLKSRLSGFAVFAAHLPPAHPDQPLCDQAFVALSPERERLQSGQLTASDLTVLLEKALSLDEQARQLPGWDEEGRIEGKLHTLINTVCHIQILTERILTVIKTVSTLDLGPASWEISDALKTVPSPFLPLTDDGMNKLEELSRSVQPLSLEHPDRVGPRRTLAPIMGDRLTLLIVEDDPAWLLEATHAAEAVAATYRGRTQEVSVETARSYEDATQRIASLSRSGWSVVLVLDLGLPRDAQELARSDADQTSIGRRWGRELLHEARRYQNRYSVIVFTVTASYAGDFEAALRSGVTPEDFVLKDREARRHLTVALENVLAPRRVPRLELLRDTDGRVRLNGREVELTLKPFRVLSMMALRPGMHYSVEQLANDLDAAYEGEYDQTADASGAISEARLKVAQQGALPGAADYVQRLNELKDEILAPLNALECWQRALRQDQERTSDSDPTVRSQNILHLFRTRCMDYTSQRPWRWAVTALQLPEGDPKDWDKATCDDAFRQAKQKMTPARIKPKSFNPESLHDDIYKIRETLYTATGVDPDSIILTQKESDGYRYRMTASSVFLDAEDEVGTELALQEGEACRVLVVEDEPSWQDEVREALVSGQYSVAIATTPTEALATARHFAPHIVCLDLNLPLGDTSGSEHRGAAGPLPGLSVLRDIQKLQPQVKAVILSALADDVRVRVAAARLGVGIRASVSKRPSVGTSWRGDVLRAVWQCEQELRRGTLLPPADGTPFVAVELEERGPKVRGAWVSTEGGTRRWTPLLPKEFELLTLFREYGNRPVERDELVEGLYGEDWPSSQGAFVNQLRRLKEAITEKGMELSKSQAGKVGNRLITEAAGYYYARFKVS